MLLYRDVVSGDEMFSDAFKIHTVDDGIAYEVDCAMVNMKEGADVDIGANPSAEDADEALEDGMISVNNVVYSFRLQATSFDKTSYKTYIKGYMKSIVAYLKENNPDRVADFQKEAQAAVKKILENWSVSDASQFFYCR